MVTSFQATLVENAINETGYYHLELYDIKEEDIKTLKNNRDVKDVFTIYENGYAVLKELQNEEIPYLKLYSMDNQTFDTLKFQLTEGRFPANEKELVISRNIISNGKVDYKIGEQITIDVGTRKTLDGYDLESSNPYNKEEEQLVDTKTYEFTIVGIMERPNYYFETYSDPGYTVISTNIYTGKQNAYLSLKNPRDYQNAITNLLGASNYEEVANPTASSNENLKDKKFAINQELLRWEAFAFSDDTVKMLYAVSRSCHFYDCIYQCILY